MSITPYDPVQWLTSGTRGLRDYVEMYLNDPDVLVEMSFPDTTRWTKEIPLEKSVVHFEQDDVQNPMLGLGEPGVDVYVTAAEPPWGDDFNRPNEGPPPSFLWVSDPWGYGASGHKVVDSIMRGDQASGVNIGSDYHSQFRRVHTADVTAQMKIVKLPIVSSGDNFGNVVIIVRDSSTPTTNIKEVEFGVTMGGGAGGLDQFYLAEYPGTGRLETYTELIHTDAKLAAGDTLILTADGSTVTGYRRDSNGVTTQMLTAQTTVLTPGYVSIYTYDADTHIETNGPDIDDFLVTSKVPVSRTTFELHEAAMHEVNFDVGVWCSAQDGGSTKRMELVERLTSLFTTARGKTDLNNATGE